MSILLVAEHFFHSGTKSYRFCKYTYNISMACFLSITCVSFDAYFDQLISCPTKMNLNFSLEVNKCQM